MEKIFTCEICGKNFEKVLSLNAHIGSHSQKHIDKKKEKLRLYREYINQIDSLFLDNKYTRLYYSIIKSAKQKDYTDMYVEKHHILPKSLGGSDDWTNIVKLSSKEHFLCHYLLTKMLMKNTDQLNSMYGAFMMMKGTSNSQTYSRYYNSRLYDSVKKEYSESQSKRMIGSNNGNFGRMWIVNYILKENKNISKEEFYYYEKHGWKKGRCFKFHLYDDHGKKIQKVMTTNNKIKKISRVDKRKEHKLLFSTGVYVPLHSYKLIEYTRKIMNISEDIYIKFDDVDNARNILFDQIYNNNVNRNMVYEKYMIFHSNYTMIDKVVMCIKPNQIIYSYKEIFKNRHEKKNSV